MTFVGVQGTNFTHKCGLSVLGFQRRMARFHCPKKAWTVNPEPTPEVSPRGGWSKDAIAKGSQIASDVLTKTSN